MDHNSPYRPTAARIAGIVATLLFHAAVAGLLVLCWLYPPTPTQQPSPLDDPDDELLLLGSEYVIAGDVDVLTRDASQNAPAPSQTEIADAPANETDAITPQGPEGTPPPQLASATPSPVKTTPKAVDNPGAKTPASTDKKPAQPSSAGGAKINSDFVNFSTDPGADPKGKTGSPDGNATGGASAGTPGFNVPGRTVAHWAKPSSNVKGRVVISVTVNKHGQVTAASVDVAKCSGSAGSNAATRQSCLQAARNSTFSVATDGSSGTKGHITYNFK